MIPAASSFGASVAGVSPGSTTNSTVVASSEAGAVSAAAEVLADEVGHERRSGGPTGLSHAQGTTTARTSGRATVPMTIRTAAASTNRNSRKRSTPPKLPRRSPYRSYRRWSPGSPAVPAGPLVRVGAPGRGRGRGRDGIARSLSAPDAHRASARRASSSSWRMTAAASRSMRARKALRCAREGAPPERPRGMRPSRRSASNDDRRSSRSVTGRPRRDRRSRPPRRAHPRPSGPRRRSPRSAGRRRARRRPARGRRGRWRRRRLSMEAARPIVASGRAPPIPEFGDGEPDPPRAEVDPQEAAHPADGTGWLAGAPSDGARAGGAATRRACAGARRRRRRARRRVDGRPPRSAITRWSSVGTLVTQSGQGTMTTSPYGARVFFASSIGSPSTELLERRRIERADLLRRRGHRELDDAVAHGPLAHLDRRGVGHELVAVG